MISNQIFICLGFVLILACSKSNSTEPDFKNPNNLDIIEMRASIDAMKLYLTNNIFQKKSPHQSIGVTSTAIGTGASFRWQFGQTPL